MRVLEMQSLWMNVTCGRKVSDVVIRQKKCIDKKACNPDEQNLDSKVLYQMRNSFREVIRRRQLHRWTHFVELVIGDPARNIIEMIFRKALTNPSKIPKKVKRVLRVKNSIEVSERFERYREKVKENSHEQCWRHPRNIVDGNELLQFYGTTMSCCCSKKMKQVSELCRNPACRVCRIIQAKFETDDMKKNGIRLSTNSEEMSDNSVAYSKLQKVERAVIVCRTIAGTVVNKVDEQYEECDSIESEGLCSHPESLIVKNPCAVLPCFVIVFT